MAIQRLKLVFLALSFVLVGAWTVRAADETIDLDMVTRLRDEGFRRSQVMNIVRHLTDVIGPRLTGSPALKQANEWTRDQFKEWGLQNAHLEAWGPFGRGWSYSRAAVHMVTPRATPLLALPKAWTPGTSGPVCGSVMVAKIEKVEDFDKLRGKLKGKILFVDDTGDLKPTDQAPFKRSTDADLVDLDHYKIPSGGPDRGDDWKKRALERFKFGPQLREFLLQEGVVATVSSSGKDMGFVRVGGGGSYRIGENPGIPELVMMTEQYNWILRLAKDGPEVTLEIDIGAQFHDDDPMAYNTVAEIPGGDLAREVVMLGGHLDSWHTGTGATDNAAGCAVAMEAVRLLETLGAKPRRTIRIALWSGEEEGLLGSRAYVAEHFASRPEPTDPEQQKLPGYLRDDQGPLTIKPDHATLSVYFNFDNGSGKIRGIYTQENAAVRPIFEAWLKPFADLGATTVVMSNTGGTDHQSFDRVGLPGFQFIQDELDYSSRTHHTNLDVYDHLQRDDLAQAAVIMAAFVYQAAMRTEQFPRKPMPKDEPPKAKPSGNAAATGTSNSR
jgi:hypothetical protein